MTENNIPSSISNENSSSRAEKLGNEKKINPNGPTIDELKRAIPKHCFHRDTILSIRYLVEDCATIFALYMAVPLFEGIGGFGGYLIWCFILGLKMFALLMLGHDCLHASFSPSTIVNDICGHLTFAPLLSPFWPWQKSHKTHHAFTNHMDKDASHPWMTEEFYTNMAFWKKLYIVFPLSGWIKWMPAYTVFGFPDGSHFWPWSMLFTDNVQRVQCVFSAITCAICGYIAFLACDSDLFIFYKYYLVPLSFFGLTLNFVTYLQHKDDDTEAYGAGEWNYVRGQTQVVDRTYGFGIEHFMHHITDGHCAHHLFPKIPHYHLLEATEHIKKVLEPYKGTPYQYKHEVTYDFLTRYFWYNIKLDCMKEKSKGVYKFRCALKNGQKGQENGTSMISS